MRIENGGGYNYTNKNAPKFINSTEIMSFYYVFNTHTLNAWYGRNIPYRRCEFSLVRNENDATFKGVSLDREDNFEFEFSVPLSVLDDLDVIIKENNLAKVNGHHEGAIGIPPNLGARFEVFYASNERIYANDNRGDVLNGIDTLALYTFFLDLARNEDEEHMIKEERIWEPHKVLKGRYETKDKTRAIEFSNSGVLIYENDKLVEEATYFLRYKKIHSSVPGSSEFFKTYVNFSWNEEYIYASTFDSKDVYFYPVENSIE